MLRYIPIGYNSFIPSYNLCIGIGIALAMLYLQYNKAFLKIGLNEQFKIHLSLLLSIILGFIGAAFLDAYTQGITITLSNFNLIGLTLWGGILVGGIVFSIILWFCSIPILKIANILTPSLCIAHAFGRIGCFMAGCCFGTPTNLPWGVKFPVGSLAYLHYGKQIYVHPTELYESLFVFIIFLIVRKRKVENKLLIYIVLYSIFRFFVEFIRADNRGEIFGQSYLSPSQVISLAALVIALIAMFLIKFKKKQNIEKLVG